MQLVISFSTVFGWIPLLFLFLSVHAEQTKVVTHGLNDQQLVNQGTSSPVIQFSQIEAGLSAGSVDGGGNLDSAGDFMDAAGVDGFSGTLDDNLVPGFNAVSVDAGSNSLLPADRFDLDDDGDLSEPVPVDALGRSRRVDGGSGTDIVDLGAFEVSVVDNADERQITSFVDGVELSMPYPNPASTTSHLSFHTSRPAHVVVALFDVLGRRVRVAFDENVPAGADIRTELDVSDLSSGYYIVRLIADSHIHEIPLTVVR